MFMNRKWKLQVSVEKYYPMKVNFTTKIIYNQMPRTPLAEALEETPLVVEMLPLSCWEAESFISFTRETWELPIGNEEEAKDAECNAGDANVEKFRWLRWREGLVTTCGQFEVVVVEVS